MQHLLFKSWALIKNNNMQRCSGKNTHKEVPYQDPPGDLGDTGYLDVVLTCTGLAG